MLKNVSPGLIENVKDLKIALNELTVYDLNVYSMSELYYKVAHKLNEVINELSRFEGVLSNEVIKQNEKLIYLLGEGLEIEVVKEIDNLIKKGFFEEIINEKIFSDLNNKIDTFKSEVDTFKSEVDTFKSEVDTFKSEIDSQLAHIANISVNVDSFYLEGDVDYTEAIVRGLEFLKTLGGGTLVFSSKDYLIKPSIITIPSNISLIGTGKSRLYTKETELYNVIISTEHNARNIKISNLIFDQTEDSDLIPKSGYGCRVLHGNDADYITVENCTFLGSYGIHVIVIQSYNKDVNMATILNNKIEWKRRVSAPFNDMVLGYDVSTIYVESFRLLMKDNYVEGIDNNLSGWKPATAYEIHIEEGEISNNRSSNTLYGLIYVNMSNNNISEKMVNIFGNDFNKCGVGGIDIWGKSLSKSSTIIKNINIYNNNINLHCSNFGDGSKYYIPTRGVSFDNGLLNKGKFENININNNNFSYSYEEDATSNKVDLSWVTGGAGIVLLANDNEYDSIFIKDNTIYNFPMVVFNICKSNLGYIRRNVFIENNKIYDCSYSAPTLSSSDNTTTNTNSIIKLCDVEYIRIVNNYIQRQNQPIIKRTLYLKNNIKDLIFNNNTIVGADFSVRCDDNEVLEGQSIDIDYLRCLYDVCPRKIYYTESTVIPNGNYYKGDIILYIGNQQLSHRGWICTDSGCIRETELQGNISFNNPYWVYYSKANEVNIGDMFETPNNENAIVENIEGNYLHVLSPLTSWQYGVPIKFYKANFSEIK